MEPINVTTIDHLFGWVREWDDASKSILQRVFGYMVKLATPVVTMYQGDLYWDAEFVRTMITGPGSFDYLVRPNGTNIGVSAGMSVRGNCAEKGSRFYRITLVQDGGQWSLIIAEYALDDVKAAAPGEMNESFGFVPASKGE